MTNHWVDFKNTDVFLIMGSNPASNHPVSFKWIMEAVEKRGAKIICVDPRFTQSAAKAHLYAPLRSGTDIAFLGGMIKDRKSTRLNSSPGKFTLMTSSA